MGNVSKLDFNKWSELIVSFLGLFVIDYFWTMDATFIRPSILLLFVVLCSIRYGLKMGGFCWAVSVIYQLVVSYLNGLDLLLLFVDFDQVKWIFLSLLAAIICGIFHTKYQEKHQIQQEELSELKQEYTELKETLNTLYQSREHLTAKILGFEKTPIYIYNMMKSLHHNHPDIVLDQLIKVVADYFGTKQVGIYMYDYGTNSLELSDYTSEDLTKNILLTEHSYFYKRLLKKQSVIFKNVTDEDNAPMIAGVIEKNGEIMAILCVNEVAFDRVNAYESEFLQCLLNWVSNCLEHAIKENNSESVKVYG
ncbi:hypothetical protein [Metabacillus endolithicus]|uniref:GAF domain-containing protein n=2 Tax=Metabacillus endolithicus TaxID=1535204 RepID=A0ABW5BZ99_9BACI